MLLHLAILVQVIELTEPITNMKDLNVLDMITTSQLSQKEMPL